ncbi:hypothetical protein GF336_07040 [Candidatus Woesearchaeota archaeon]|nr:hypothetical protein [Candidatus Woesearchaeota archaeon]
MKTKKADLSMKTIIVIIIVLLFFIWAVFWYSGLRESIISILNTYLK